MRGWDRSQARPFSIFQGAAAAVVFNFADVQLAKQRSFIFPAPYRAEVIPDVLKRRSASVSEWKARTFPFAFLIKGGEAGEEEKSAKRLRAAERNLVVRFA